MTRIAPLTGRPVGTSREEPESPVASSPPLSVREIFDAYAAFVWRTLRHLGVSERDVEDVCQEVFVTVHRKLDTFEGRSSVRTWLYGICLRTAADYRRRAYVRREKPLSEPPAAHVSATQFEAVARRELGGVLMELLQQLDEDKRAVFVLHEIEELPMREVADIVGCPMQTAYSRFHAARRLLLEALQKRKVASHG